jgi:hypothetical protein
MSEHNGTPPSVCPPLPSRSHSPAWTRQRAAATPGTPDTPTHGTCTRKVSVLLCGLLSRPEQCGLGACLWSSHGHAEHVTHVEEGGPSMDLQLLQTIAIIALVSFILGIIMGAVLTRPRMVQRRPSRKWEE